jgi:phage terminase large subunit-like protein
LSKYQRKKKVIKTPAVTAETKKNKALAIVNKKKAELSKLSRAEKIIYFAENYCLVPEGPMVGQKIKLEEFQKEFIRAVYSDTRKVRRAILSMAKKNGKTALIAILLLAHLVGPEAKQNTQIVSGALSREQASLVFELAVKMINLSPTLSAITRIIPSHKRLVGLKRNVEYRALSAEGKTAQGISPILAILDETGQVIGPKDEFIDAIVTSQGAHDNPLLIVISTQAQNDSDLLSIWIDDAQKSKDPRIVCHLYAAPEEADLLDEKAWHAANPALGVFRNFEDLKELANQAKRMPSSESAFRNLNLNQRTSKTTPFVSKTSWNDCNKPPVPIGLCTEIYGAIDLSARTDLTAFILLGYYDGYWNVYPYFWTPGKGLEDRARRDRAPYDLWNKQGFLLTTPGATIDYEFAAANIAEIVADIELDGVAFDRWRIDILKKEFERIGIELPLVEWGQGFKDMSPALDALEGLVLNKQLNHGAHPVLTMCASNSMITRDPAGNRKLDKTKTSGRIDGMVALAMAAGLAERKNQEQGRVDDFLDNPIIL